MNHREIRRTFLAFYAERGHTIVPSSSLIPKDDPTLLFTSAGMVQFKPFYAGTVPLPYTRAVSIQKCLRATDLEQVGKSIKYNTFFEMLGNFSFGDYFKAEAIPWAWEYLTEVVLLPKDRLYVSVFTQDQEAYEIWQKKVGLPTQRIYRLGEEDNFWGPAGGVGACGPCSEIYFDMGEEFGCGKVECGPGCNCERFIEIYNIVFPQFDQQPDGTRLPLKNRGIDTGMGMERLAMVSQGKKSIFETDLFAPIVKAIAKALDLNINAETKPMIYAAADHTRALTFAIADGQVPSNEARGYILRSILRRASLMARKVGINQPFMYRISGEVIELFRQFYPELVPKREQIALIIKAEEERFLRTIDEGLERFKEVAETHKTDGIIPGIDIFKLHDTFGFPVELTKELADEQGLTLDMAGFEQAMQEQREKSKKEIIWTERISFESEGAFAQTFVGYDKDEVTTNILDYKEVEKGSYEILLQETPFYAEAGGQVGDTGKIIGPDFELAVIDSYYKTGSKIRLVKAKLQKGEISKTAVTAIIDKTRRREIERAHTATHLLHSALRRTLGEYCKQEGSLVEPGRFRFDFVAFQPLTQEQINKVEQLVYSAVIENIKVEHLRNLPIEEAKKMGALAFFGEEYGERVNVIKIGDFSCELCGGTHIRATGEIGMFKIISETGVAAGIRRIEALVGLNAYRHSFEEREILLELQQALGVAKLGLTQKINELKQYQTKLENRLRQVSAHLINLLSDQLIEKAEKTQDIKLIFANYQFFDVSDLRQIADVVRERMKEKVVGLLFSSQEERLRYIVFVSKDLEAVLPAGKIAQAVGKALEGGGGGKPNLAEGGGKKENLEKGISAFKEFIQSALSI
ncbi:MAG: alanine--tRNA ligase [candidate division WOR-3 bacterium]